MRYVHGLVCVFAFMVAMPLSANAQAGEEGTEPNLQQPAPSSPPIPEEPALQLKLDTDGVDVTPSPLRTADEYTLKELELRLKRASIGFGVSGAVVVAGGVLALAGFGHCGVMGPWTETCNRLTWTGIGIASAGAVAVIATGILYGVRNRELRRRKRREWDRFRYGHSGTPRRVQWDLAQSRLVF